MKTGKWTNDERDCLKNNYRELGSVGVARILQRSPRHVNSMAMHLKLKRGWGTKPRFRKYLINEQIFKTWSNTSAYLVGLILADGNIGERDFSITSKDIELLEKSKAALESKHPISKCIGRNLYKLCIGNKSMVSDLKSIGITEKKSKTITLPDIPREYFFDFLRGYSDGDGMTLFTKQGGLQFKISTGSPFILDDISDTITALLGIDKHHPKTNTQQRRETISTWYELTYCGQCALLICEAMYNHCEYLYLSRKRQSFLDYKSRPKRDRRSLGNATKYHSL